MFRIFLFFVLFLSVPLQKVDAKVHLVLVFCKEEVLSYFKEMNCSGYDRVILYSKCGFIPDGFPTCVRVLKPPSTKYARVSKAEETFLYDMIEYRKQGYNSKLLAYMKASTFKLRVVEQLGSTLDSLPDVAMKVDYVSFSFGRSTYVDLCGHPVTKKLREVNYRGLCKGNVVLRAAFGTSSKHFHRVPTSVLEKLYTYLSKPPKFKITKQKLKFAVAPERVKIVRQFLEDFWQLLFDCASETHHARYCRSSIGHGDPSARYVNTGRGSSVFADILNQRSKVEKELIGKV